MMMTEHPTMDNRQAWPHELEWKVRFVEQILPRLSAQHDIEVTFEMIYSAMSARYVEGIRDAASTVRAVAAARKGERALTAVAEGLEELAKRHDAD